MLPYHKIIYTLFCQDKRPKLYKRAAVYTKAIIPYRNMKIVLVLLLVGIAAAFAQVGDLVENDNGTENLSVEDDFEGLADGDNVNGYDEEALSQAALSIMSTGRPNCLDRTNWGQRFRHNWYTSRFWQCNRWKLNLQSCAIPRLYQPSLERCVWAWHWKWEPIQRDDGTTPQPEDTTWPWTDTSTTQTCPDCPINTCPPCWVTCATTAT